MSAYKRSLRSLPHKYVPGVMLKLDGRSTIYRRFRATYDNIIEDLGGEDALSQVQLTLVERYAFLNSLLSEIEAEIAKAPGSDKDLENRHTNTNNALLGLAKTLGLKRKAPSVPSIRAYAGGRRA